MSRSLIFLRRTEIQDNPDDDRETDQYLFLKGHSGVVA